jgi:tetratricopeptide (TPR) repeat protein
MLGAAAVLVGLGYYSDRVLDASASLLKSTKNPDLRAQAMAVRAHSLLTLLRTGEAASAVEEALAAGESLDLYLVGAAAAGQLGDNEARSSYLRDAVRLIENDNDATPDEVAVGGLIAAILRQFNRALTLADRALEADGGSDVALPLRAHCLLRLDRAEEALATARTKRAVAIPSPLLIVTRAEALGRLGRHSESLMELSGPLPIDKSALAPLLSQLQEVSLPERKEMLRARAMRNLGKGVEALSVLKELLRKSPTYVDAWEELAAYHLGQEDAVAAHRALLEAERLDPGRHSVRERLAYAEGVLWVTRKGRVDSENAVRLMVGNEAWNSLAEESRLALASAEISNRNTVGVESASDFGPVVAQLARAVELELNRRVFEPFREAAIRMRGRSAFQTSLADEYASEQLFPFLRFLRTPLGGLSLGPMLSATDLALAGDASPILALLRRFFDDAYASPIRARELLADPELRFLNATRNQGLHRTTVGWQAARRCRRFLLGDAPGRGWLVSATRTLAPRPAEDLLNRSAAVRRPPTR